MSIPPAAIEPKSPIAQPSDDRLPFEQYKLAVEMAAGISARRQNANSFYIGLISALSALYTLIERDLPLSKWSTLGRVMLLIPVVVCWLWGSTVYSYRRINIAKWDVIYGLEKTLPHAPFKSEAEKLGKKVFALTKLELAAPILIGLVYLLLAVSALLGKGADIHQ